MQATSHGDSLAAYVRRGNRRVEGWLLPGAIDMICRAGQAQAAAGIQGHVAEIGIHHGRLFILLALLARPEEKAVAIDLFQQQELNKDRSGRGNLARFRANMSRYAATSALVVHEGDSTEITGRDVIALAGGPVRLFSIDGGHTAATTLHDLETAEAALAPGGLIILDDCFNEFWPDVSTGVHRFFSSPRRVVPIATGGNKTFLTFPETAELYRAALVGCGTNLAVHEFAGHSVCCLEFTRPPLVQTFVQSPAWRAIRNLPGVSSIRVAYRARRGA